jgi:nitrite reductase/ring-hydroxylating ferredoxin subunit
MVKQRVQAVLRASDIPSGTCKTGIVDGEEIAVFNVDGRLYAVQATCTHMGGQLCEGALWGEIVTCPWHGSEFNVRTGEVVTGPAEVPLKTYRVSVDDDVITVTEG